MKKAKRELKKRRHSRAKRPNIKLIGKKQIVVLLMLCTIIAIFTLINNNVKNNFLTPEILRSKAYETAPTDEKGKLVEIKDADGNTIETVYFDAYFIKDLDGDGVAESRLRRKL